MTSQIEQAAVNEPRTVTIQASDLVVVLRKERGGPVLAREPVLPGDLSDLFSELWRDGWLRAGRPEVPYGALLFDITARVAEGGPKCEKLVFRAEGPEGRARSLEPATQALQDVASRAAQALMEAKVLESDDLYYYEVALRGEPSRPPEDDGPGFTISAKNVPLGYLEIPIKPLIERAEAKGTVDDGAFPVFFTAEALRSAQRVSQKGADDDPPAETGGVLVGPLCSCRETGEFFVVVSEVLEARDAEGSSLSLSYTGKTWARIQSIIKAKQSRRKTRAHRIVGQAHGHNLLPGGSCADCEKAKECKLTSVFVSLDDRTWSKAVFSRQPWHICHIFGLNARGEPVHALYTLKENALQQRGFYLLPDFDPAEEETQDARSD